MTEYTQGEWRVYQHPSTPTPELFDVVGATRDDTIAENVSQENARLIAAAPKLLEALEKISNWSPKSEPQDPESCNYDDYRDYGSDLAYWEVAQCAKAAIAAAKGE